MQAMLMQRGRHALGLALAYLIFLAAAPALAAPYAAMVMDARNGEVIFARNHDTRLHPASLTKMMTLYVAFEAIKHGEVTLDTQFTVSRNATQTSCVCLGLRPGQKISLRYLIRAAALRSANDASVVIAEGISGSVEAFAARMTRTASAMGMSNTTFRNPHGLTQSGHVSTARDMTILGRQLYFDYPQYFNIFSRRSDFAGVANVPNTNRRFLDAYAGADGIKTGYTRAAGFNLTASAKRGGRHIIATMFGGSTAAARNAHVAELMDIGFNRAAARVATAAPRTPAYQGRGTTALAQASTASSASGATHDRGASARTIRLQTAVRRSPRPESRPLAGSDDPMMLAMRQTVDAVLAEAVVTPLIALDGEGPGRPLVDLGTAAARPVEALATTPPARPPEILVSDAETAPVADDVASAVAAGFTVATEDDSAPAEDIAAAVAAGFGIVEEEDLARIETSATQLPEAATTAPPSRIDQLETVMEPAATEEGPGAYAADAARSEEFEIASLAPVLPQRPGAADASAARDGAQSLSDQSITAPQAAADAQPVSVAPAQPSRPQPDPGIILTTSADTQVIDSDLRTAVASDGAGGTEILSRISSSDSGRIWGVSLGRYNSRHAAERSLIEVKMAEAAALGNGVSRIRQASGQFEASFAGLTEAEAERACLRLEARSVSCSVAHP